MSGQDHGPRVTVVVTCFNQQQWIGQALDSVAAQSERHVQIIVTDDGSSDDSRAVIAHWIDAHDVEASVVMAEQNVGLPAMLNRAMSKIAGQYVVVLNGDDWMDPNRLAVQAASLDEASESVGLVYSDLRVVDAAGTPTGEVFPPADVERRQGDVLRHIIAQPMIGMPCVMFRRRVLDVIGPWDESLLADDYDFLLRVAAAGFEFRYVPALVVNYRQHGQSLTGERGAALAEGRFLALRKLLGRDDTTDDVILTRMCGLALALHSMGYDGAATRRHLRFVTRRRPSKRLVRALVENHLGFRPGALARSR